MPIPAKSRSGSRNQPEQTRAAILEAAAVEFAQRGLAGARIEAIARRAAVNKALLYYYFHDKEALYGAVLDSVFSKLKQSLLDVLELDLPPREKMLAYTAAHFNFIASAHTYPRLVQQEMMGAGPEGSPHLPRLVKNYLRPVFVKVAELIRAGIAAGDFRPVDPMQFIPSLIAIIVFYFAATPVLKLLQGGDPLAPARIAERRTAVLGLVQDALWSSQSSTAAGADRRAPSRVRRHPYGPPQPLKAAMTRGRTSGVSHPGGAV
jgi:TetR/AcrR family transcriptional regulator